MKQIALLFLFLCSVLTVSAQAEWRQLPANPNLAGLTPTNYDILTADNGYYYMVYTVMNGTSVYEVHFDLYTVQYGWESLLVHPTTNSFAIDVKTLRCGTNFYVMFNSNSASEATLFQISAASAYQLTASNFTGFDAYANWDMYPGTTIGEIYMAYKASGVNYVYAFDYGTQLWTNAGNPFAGTGIYPDDNYLYVNQDSVFIAAKYYDPNGNKLKLRAAAKGIWNWGNHTPGGTSVYALNSGVPDTITGSDKYFIYGDQINSSAIVARDNSVSKDFKITANSYSEAAAFPLNYDLTTRMATNAANAFMITSAANLAHPNVVYSKALSGTAWSQLTSAAFAPDGIVPDKKRIKTHPTSDRVMIAYVNNAATPADYVLKITNNAPTLLNVGTSPLQLCANSDNQLRTLFTEDLDDDQITIVGITSSNNTLIDPADIFTNTIDAGTNLYDIYSSITLGDVATVQNVTLTYTLTDGFDVLTHSITYTIQPNTLVEWTDDELYFCNNGDPIDLYDYVSIPGGQFGISEGTYEGHYLDPTDYSWEDELELYYSVDNGTCGSSADGYIFFHEAPTATITTLPSANCSSNDGSATLALSGGLTPYTFVWNTGDFTNLEIFDLAPGSVHVDASDANGCVVVANGIVAATGATVTGITQAVSCHGMADGAIDLTVAGVATPFSVLWSNGYSTEDVSNLQPGNHEVWITDPAGCIISQSFTITEPDELYMYLQGDFSECGSSTGGAYINNLEGGTAPYTYLWNNGGIQDFISNVSSGVYSVTVTDDNGCTVSQSYGVSDFDSPYVYNEEITDAACNMNNGAITVEFGEQGTNAQLQWSTGSNNTTTISGLAPGWYTAHTFNSEGCHRYNIYEVKVVIPERQQICVVTVDEATTTNLVVWEKNGDPAIHHYNIYRETMVAGEYQRIDTVMNNNSSIFNDVVASPVNHSWKYRITAVDDCSTESIPSTAHKTIHLTAEDLGNGDFKAIWNFYEGTTYTMFNVYRYTNSTGWEHIGTTPANQNYFTDTPPNTAGLDYKADFELSATCRADFEKAQDFNSSRSNKDKAAFNPGNGTGDSNNGLIETTFGEGSVKLYPNPVSGTTVFVELTGITDIGYTIVSVTGQQAAEGQLAEGISGIQTSDLQPGVYILHLTSSNARTSIRFILQ